ncbi:MAG: alpha/beta fold hydrolase [Cytophagales bacterium]|nr:alpha/beta fold hydrolase [Armatimonadota bacterium]
MKPASRNKKVGGFWGLAALGVGVAAVACFPAALAWGFLHPPRRLHDKTPLSALGISFERVRLRTQDGVSLSAWYVPAPEHASVRGVIVVCHGYYGNRATMLPYLAFLHEAGYAAVLFDWRAHGWSGGRMATFGCTEPDDLAAVLDWVGSHPGLRSLPLALLGESMGASVALLVAAEEPERVRAVVADSPYARFDSAVEGRLQLALGPRVAPLVTPSARRAGETMLGVHCDQIAPLAAMGRIFPRPVLLIHGQEDRLIAPENSRRIWAASPGNTTLWEVPGAEHVRSVYVAREEYARRVTEFLDAALTAP